MNREEKQHNVEVLNGYFRSTNNAFLINYSGLKVVDATEVRRKIREIDGHFVVVKNTLALRAVKETALEQLESFFQGPTAIAFHPKDAVGIAKLLTDIRKGNPHLEFKAALVEGKVVSPGEIQAIASLPSREVMLSKLAFLLKAPLQKLTSVLNAPLRDLGLVLKQVPK
ncbi:MAG: 50S ribosomal protein L10 [Acidobacteriota bacterium]|jgi:large subunit ribosomal protein L10|nr:50S ribosomal protein L10 [Acidobacteriota bacterium]NLT33594.1 50S ribosomal protein L10 [Acidobacteriota bacterium]